LTLSACTASTPIVEPTGSASPSVSPSPSVTKSPVVPLEPVRAAVIYDGSIHVYDVQADRSVPLVGGPGMSGLTWISANELAVAQNGSGTAAVRSIDARTGSFGDLISVNGQILAFAVDQMRSVVAVMIERSDGFVDVELQYLIGDRAVHRIASFEATGSKDELGEQQLLKFSPDGQRLVIVNTEISFGTEAKAGLQVRRLDGRLEYWVGTDREPTQANWLADGSLVFRSLDGVRRWKPGRDSSLPVDQLSTWFAPWGSPNGKLVAYDTGRVTKNVQVRRVNVFSGKVVDVGSPGRANPIYAAQDAIWVQGVQRCRPDCDEPYVLGSLVYSINPATGEEKPLQLPSLDGLALWGEAAS
jgi:hypothetical protein